MKKGRLIKITGGCLLWLFFFAVFFFVLFPGDAFFKWAEYKLEERLNAEITIMKISIQSNLDLFIEKINFKNNLREVPLDITLREITLKPDIKRLIRGIPSFSFKAKIFENGIVAGNYNGSKNKNLVFHWEGVNSKEIKLPRPGENSHISTITNGEAFLIIVPEERTKGSESIELKIENLNLPFKEIKFPPIPLAPQHIVYGKVRIFGSQE